MTKFKIRTQDKSVTLEEYKQANKNPIYIVLDNLRSAMNVGSIFRTADTILAQEILLCGTSVTPTNPKLQKTAMGAEKFVDWKYFKYTYEAIQYLKELGVKIYAIETTSISKNIFTMEKLDLPLAFVFGNEALGIEPEIIGMCDEVLEIPLQGFKNSLNVSNAAAIVLFETIRKMNLF